MAKYQYGRFGFNRKSDVIDHCRNILARYNEGERILLKDDHDFLSNLLLGHKDCLDKIGGGIHYFTNRKMPPYNNKCFFIVRTDGSEIDFSFMQCISPSDHRKDVLQSMRMAVLDQILAFKDDFFESIRAGDNSLVCPITGMGLTRQNTHIDHAAPITFQYLADLFLKLNDITYGHIRLNESPDGFGSVFDDLALINEWRRYHAKFAILRAVHRDANLSILKRTKSRGLTKV